MNEAVSVRLDAETVVLDRLRQAAGSSAVLDPDELPRYAVAGVVPRAVVIPESVEATARAVALCAAQRWPVEPAGAATWLHAGAPPAAPPVVISTAGLRRIREYEPANLVVGVDAGMPLEALAAELAGHRQFIPLDPPAAPAATIGAAVALAAAGPLRAAHGTPRDMVIGAEFITGDGHVLQFGGRVVKNVAGYDIVRLLVGSRGAFGLLTSFFIRLRGATDLDATVAVSATSSSAALELAGEIRRGMSPDALEVIGPGLAREVLPAEAADGWAVLVRLRGSDAAGAEAEERLGTIAGPAGHRLTAGESAAAWQQLGAAEAAAPLCLRLADLPARLAQTLAAAVRLVDAARAAAGTAPDAGDWRLAVHAADGIVRVWPSATPDEASLSRLAGALPAVTAELATNRGTVTWPVWPAAPHASRPAHAGDPSDAHHRLLAGLKARFDPAGILSPRRHFAGI